MVHDIHCGNIDQVVPRWLALLRYGLARFGGLRFTVDGVLWFSRCVGLSDQHFYFCVQRAAARP